MLSSPNLGTGLPARTTRIGVAHRLCLWHDQDRVDVRSVIDRFATGSGPLDPADPVARRLPSGSTLSAEGDGGGAGLTPRADRPRRARADRRPPAGRTDRAEGQRLGVRRHRRQRVRHLPEHLRPGRVRGRRRADVRGVLPAGAGHGRRAGDLARPARATPSRAPGDRRWVRRGIRPGRRPDPARCLRRWPPRRRLPSPATGRRTWCRRGSSTAGSHPRGRSPTTRLRWPPSGRGLARGRGPRGSTPVLWTSSSPGHERCAVTPRRILRTAPAGRQTSGTAPRRAGRRELPNGLHAEPEWLTWQHAVWLIRDAGATSATRSCPSTRRTASSPSSIRATRRGTGPHAAPTDPASAPDRSCRDRRGRPVARRAPGRAGPRGTTASTAASRGSRGARHAAPTSRTTRRTAADLVGLVSQAQVPPRAGARPSRGSRPTPRAGRTGR